MLAQLVLKTSIEKTSFFFDYSVDTLGHAGLYTLHNEGGEPLAADLFALLLIQKLALGCAFQSAGKVRR